ncbi:hypothetical protein NDU88_008682 [Pleurodeles waltl]|uniref:Uncharacterized protein n=1 Tax=Pleurodeles waltl TaxID=8319 RepID=A0AAV7PSX5_PLEWA|nr:hypothetical protein NDU88_008682 [Pleurodeles waltl]
MPGRPCAHLVSASSPACGRVGRGGGGDRTPADSGRSHTWSSAVWSRHLRPASEARQVEWHLGGAAAASGGDWQYSRVPLSDGRCCRSRLVLQAAAGGKHTWERPAPEPRVEAYAAARGTGRPSAVEWLCRVARSGPGACGGLCMTGDTGATLGPRRLGSDGLKLELMCGGPAGGGACGEVAYFERSGEWRKAADGEGARPYETGVGAWTGRELGEIPLFGQIG